MAPEIVFAEDPAGGKWRGRFLNASNVEGFILGRPARQMTGTIVTIKEVRFVSGGQMYEWKTPGEFHPGGNRHHAAMTLTEAQERIAKWAGRRFRFAKEGDLR